MKRYLNPILWSGFAALLISSLFVFENRTHAESAASLQRKISKDILQKVAEGKSADFVRVIVQPANPTDVSIDSTLETSGGSNIRKFKNFAVRIVTLPVSAAVALANRSDVSYVSLNETSFRWAMSRGPRVQIRFGPVTLPVRSSRALESESRFSTQVLIPTIALSSIDRTAIASFTVKTSPVKVAPTILTGTELTWLRWQQAMAESQMVSLSASLPTRTSSICAC